MGKKGATPEPAKEEEEPAVQQEPPTEQLEGDFVFPDGSEYSGQYLKKGEDVCFHGEGLFQSGPEAFKGTFEHGHYKKGKYTGCNGSVYSGSFCRGLYNGQGTYTWPDGRKIYRGMWKDGRMHGKGEYENFSFGVDRLIRGFSVHGSFHSGIADQEEAKEAFLAEYTAVYTASALAALRRAVATMEEAAVPAGPKGAPAGAAPPKLPAEFLVPAAPPEGEPEDPSAAAERLAVEQLVAGPFPEAAAFSMTTLKAFIALFPEAGEQAGKATVYEDRGQCQHFDGARLKCEQLEHVGQGVELHSPQEAEVGSLSVLVLVNVSTEYDVQQMRWKIVLCEDVPPPDEAAAADGRKGK
mmetsp:Transcript_62774/g.194840  ORF Transcript_62774/g.194840 Transcript_62774/m.194840 type:complete len:353 (-) Transcript_62774:135-1193(-)